MEMEKKNERSKKKKVSRVAGLKSQLRKDADFRFPQRGKREQYEVVYQSPCSQRNTERRQWCERPEVRQCNQPTEINRTLQQMPSFSPAWRDNERGW